ncbi:uncharacterized protein LOC144232095 isoform X2 [Crocuta crocuta]
MTCQALPLLLVVLLLASGSWAQSQRDELVWAIQEQVLSVKCPSAPLLEITKKSSGAYWCGIDRGSAEGIIILKNISLVVTAMTSSSTFNSGSEDCTPDNTFMVLLCGLLVIKILALTALLLFLTYRAQVSTGIVGVAVVAAPSPTKTPGPLRTPH